MSDTRDELEAIRARKRDAILQRTDEPPSTDAPIEITDPAHFDEVTGSHPVVLVDFHAEWCGPCQMMAPTIDRLAGELESTFAKVDIDRHNELANAYGIRSVPTLILFVDGEPVQQLIGLQDEQSLRDVIASHSNQ